MSSVAKIRQQRYVVDRVKRNESRGSPGRFQERTYSQRTLELENKDETIQSNSYFYEETESQRRGVIPGGLITG